MSVTGALIRNVIAPLWALKERTPYLQHIKDIEAMHRWPLERIRRNQLHRLQSICRHAFEQTDYYHEQLTQAGITAGSITSLSDLQNIPILTKDDIRLNKERMVASSVSPDQLIPGKTSGSTGVSLEFCQDENSRQWKRAATITYDRWSGWDMGERVGAIWGNPECYQHWRLYLRNLLLTRHIYLDTLKMDEQTMLNYHSMLLNKSPVILYGHAHSLFLFAKFIQQKGLSKIRPKGIISTCMVLHDFERRIIEEVFACRVTNRYGCEEVSLIACECSEGKMHLNCDTLIVEFIRDGKPVSPGEPGSIVVTDLTNFGMPFLRYKVGDVGIPSATTGCPCGCTYPIMDSLEGRVADYVVTPDGVYISGISLTENFAMQLPGLKQMQIVQEQVDLLIFRVVKGEHFTEQTEQEIGRLARERFGSRMHWQLEYVDTIQSELSGKYRFCISKLPNQFS